MAPHIVQVTQESLCWDRASWWSFQVQREVWRPGGSACWEWTVSPPTGTVSACEAARRVSLGPRGEALLGYPRATRVWIWNNTSMAQGLSLLTRSPRGKRWMCCSLLRAGGNSAEQNKVILRTKWLNQVKSYFRADISLTLATRFFLLSAFEPQ